MQPRPWPVNRISVVEPDDPVRNASVRDQLRGFHPAVDRDDDLVGDRSQQRKRRRHLRRRVDGHAADAEPHGNATLPSPQALEAFKRRRVAVRVRVALLVDAVRHVVRHGVEQGPAVIPRRERMRFMIARPFRSGVTGRVRSDCDEPGHTHRHRVRRLPDHRCDRARRDERRLLGGAPRASAGWSPSRSSRRRSPRTMTSASGSSASRSSRRRSTTRTSSRSTTPARPTGCLYIAMRYVDGGDLGSLIEAGRPLGLGQTIFILEQVAGALDARAPDTGSSIATSSPPTSWSATPSDRVYLTDFGVAKQARHARPDEDRVLRRHVRVRGAGADRAQADRRAHRPLRARLRAVRVPERSAAVRRGHRGVDAARASGRAAAPVDGRSSRPSPHDRRRDRNRDREGQGGSLRDVRRSR